MSLRPCGWLPDPEPTKAFVGMSQERAKADLAGGIPDSASLPFPVWDPTQIGNSCTGHSAVLEGYGLTGRKFSPYHSYYWGLVHDQGPDDPADLGVSFASISTSMIHHGLAPWKYWNPASPGFSPTGRPPAIARVKAQQANVDVVRVFAYGDGAKTEAVCSSIANEFPPALVVTVDEGFDNPGPGGIVGPEKGPSRGLHIINAWSYEQINGRTLVYCPDHWGRGGVYLTEARIEQSPYLNYARGLS